MRFIALFLLPLAVWAQQQNITIYVNNHFKKSNLTQSRWGATIEHLNRVLPQYRFTLLPINPKEISRVKTLLDKKSIDFLITQPLIYSELHYTHGVTRLLTLQNRFGMTQFGSVLITRKSSGIESIEDIKGRTVAAVAPLGFGGWLIGYDTLMQHGIDPVKDQKVAFIGSQTKIVREVLKGTYDVGIIRTGMLELLLHEHLLDKDALHIINRQARLQQVISSTPLYPEWVFAVAKHVDNRIARRVIREMIAITKNDKAAKEGLYSSWFIPEDYSSVDQLLKKYRLAYYKDLPRYDTDDMIAYVAGTVLLLLLLFTLFFFYWRYRMLILSKRELQSEVTRISQEIREKDQLMLVQSRHAAMGEMLSMIAHQWRQPLTVISSVISNIIIKRSLGKYDSDLLETDLQSIENTVVRLSQTVSDFKSYFEPNGKKKAIYIADTVMDLRSMIEDELTAKGIQLLIDIQPKVVIYSYANELLQVLLNLVKNSQDILLERTINEPIIMIRVFQEKKSVVIEVEDNGGGIGDAVEEHMFEPYYTTKDMNGTGLGLYMSKIIIEKQLDGYISYKKGQAGACFVVKLPGHIEQSDSSK